MSESEDNGGGKMLGCALFFALPIAIGVGCLVGADYGLLKGIAAGCLTFPGVIILGFCFL